MKREIYRITLLFSILFFASITVEANSSTHDIIIHKNVDPLYPQKLIQEAILEGSVTYQILVNSEDELVDAFPIRATEEEFIEAIERVMDQWTFEAAQQNGEKYTAITQVTFNFKFNERIVYVNFTNAMNIVHQNTFAEKYEYKAIYAGRLEQLPEPIHTPPPVVHQKDAKKDLNVIFRFYIDREGRVRMPILKSTEASNLSINQSLYTTLTQWRFKPAIYEGEPAVVLVEQAFRL